MKKPSQQSGVRSGARSNAAPAARPTAGSEVDAFLADLKHPQKAEILALRKLILAADRSINEGIKWNAPSFFTTEHFATFHLRAKTGLQLVMHRGARRRADVAAFAVEDPQGLLEWRDGDRAVIHFKDLKDVRARKTALTRIVQQWVKQV